jgi:hypothetical protein
MAHIHANNAFSYLTGDLEPTAQDLSIRGADAGLFPQPDQAKGEVFMVALEHRATNKMEIVECFRRVGPILSVRRAREGTTPEAFGAGTTVSNRLTAGVIQGGLLGWAEFNRRYLGAYATQPTLDPLGFPLQRGAIMYDLNTDALFVFTVDGWVKWSPSGDLQTGIPPGGAPGDALTRNSQGLIEWQPVVDRNARDTAAQARTDVTAALAAIATNAGLISTKVDRGGDVMTGPLNMAPPADANGAANPLIYMSSRKTGGAYLRQNHDDRLFADLVLTPNDGPYYTRWNPDGSLLSNRKMLLTGDALPSGGGTVTGATTFNSLVQMPGGNRVRNLYLSPQDAGAEGGEVTFEGSPGYANMTQDLAGGTMRWFRSFDGAMLMTLNNTNGTLDVNNSFSAGYIQCRGNINTPGSFVGGAFIFNEPGFDTGAFSSGDGYGTLFSNNQPSLQWQPGGNVYVWGNITAFSDRRMKEDIGIIENPLELIDKMEGVTFHKIGDATKRRHVGFIAQDVEELIPALIERSHGHGDRDMLGVNYAAYVSVLNEGIKALHQKVLRLEAILHA